MNKPEYSDLYKFIVSLGLILIVFSVVLPWLFLRESFDTMINVSELQNLSPTAQSLISYRQTIALWFVQNILWISLIPALIGLVLLVGGLIFWQRKQKLIDQKDVLETEKLRIEVKKMTPEQIAEKVIREASEEVQAEQNESKSVAETSRQINVINNYFQIEKKIIDKLASCFGSANVRPNLKVRDTNVDVLVRVSPKERAIFEIKLVDRLKYIERRQREVVETLSKGIAIYNTIEPKEDIYGVGLLILGGGYADKSIPKYAENKKMVTSSDNGTFIRIITLTEKEFIDLQCSELKSFVTKP